MHSNNHSPEFKLLLSCSRVKPSQKELEVRAKIFRLPIDESRFLFLTKRHLVAPIVYFNLKNESRISNNLKSDLKLLAEHNQFKVLLTKQMIIRLQKKFLELNVKGLFLKGVPLSEMYYGDVGLRDTMDIDVWVEETGFVEICNYLQSLGYTSNLDLSSLNSKQIAYKYKTDHHLLFTINHPQYPAIIELHWKIRGRLGIFTFNPNERFSELISYDSSNTLISVFSHVDNLLFLCTHGCDHAWYRLKWFFDLPQLIDKIEFNWNDVLNRAEQLNCVDQLLLSFLLLNKLLNQPIPAELQLRLQNNKHKLSWSLRYVEHCMLYNGLYCDTDNEKLLNLRYVLSQNKKGILNPTLFYRHLTSENDWKLLPLPSYLFFLYFPLRPFMLLWRRITNH